MRVLLVGMSNMLSNIVAAVLARAPDIVVVGHVANEADLAAEIRLSGADAAIVHTDEPAAATAFTPLLLLFPELKVVAIDAASRAGFLHQLRQYSTAFTEVSTDALLAALLTPSISIQRAEDP
jgi:hypothetical protein